MRTGRAFGLFEVFGLELEYMIVDKETLKIKHIVDEVIRKKVGQITSDVDNGTISWSNELTAHVIELKTTVPSPTLDGLSTAFLSNIREINDILEAEHAMLLPSAAHPLMDPFKESKLWAHEYNEVYEIYNKIFDCRGHGWSNLQSFHLNLPFQNDLEFERLHAAIRIILPIIPALSASSPILDGKNTGYIDARMEAYLHHQEKMPSLMGPMIPEQVFSEIDYHKVIYDPIMKDIGPYDTNKVMEHHFLNSRGAIARFDRGAIEIRVIDVQECAAADIAICSIIVELLKALVSERISTLQDQKSWSEKDLRKIFDSVIKTGSKTVIENETYLALFGIERKSIQLSELWGEILGKVKLGMTSNQAQRIGHIIQNGNLSERILVKLNNDFSKDNIVKTYSSMAKCLQSNTQL